MNQGSTALIYGNGKQISQKLFAALYKEHPMLVAADGGTAHVLAHGAVPDLIIGDMDSFTDEPPTGVPVIRDPDQETNDLQKALSWVLARGVQEVTVVGATGDRVDHNLNNLSVLLEFTPRFTRLELVDDFGRHTVVRREQTFPVRPGGTVSLYPLSGEVTGITTEGLRYPLTDEPLAPGVRTGCLNEATAEWCRVFVASGALLVTVAHPPGGMHNLV